MLPQTGDRHRGVARCAGELGGLDNWGFLFPGTYWLCVVHHFHRYIILAAGGAGVAHTTGTGGMVAVVPVPHWVMAVRCHTAGLLTPGWLGVLLPTTGHLHIGHAPALLSDHLETWGAIASVVPLRAVVVSTGQHLSACVPTRGGGLSAVWWWTCRRGRACPVRVGRGDRCQGGR